MCNRAGCFIARDTSGGRVVEAGGMGHFFSKMLFRSMIFSHFSPVLLNNKLSFPIIENAYEKGDENHHEGKPMVINLKYF